MSLYNLHNFITIKINQDKLNLGTEYNHYLRAFKSDIALNLSKYEIEEFSKFKLPENHNKVGEALGFEGGVYFPNEKYAIEFDGRTLKEYTSYANRATNLWLQLLLLPHDASLVHCAGAEINGHGIIFPAFGGVGKTILISQLRKLSNFKFFGDDYVIADKNHQMYSYPSDLSVYPYHLSIFPELRNSMYARYLSNRRVFALYYFTKKAINYAWKRMGRTGTALLPGWNAEYVKVPVDRVIDRQHIGSQTEIRSAIFLDRYDGDKIKIDKITADQIAKLVDGILWLEFKYGLKYLVSLAASGNIDLAKVVTKQRKVLTNVFSNLRLHKVSIPQNLNIEEYLQFMTKFIQELPHD